MIPSIQDTQSFSNRFGVPSEQKQSGTPFKSENLPGDFRDTQPEMSVNEIESEHDHDQPKQKFHSSDSQAHTYSEGSKWTAIQRLDSEIELVDIQEFVRNSEKADGMPILELMEDVSLDDEASRFKVGQWGEQYVFIILQKKGYLPDGSHIRSISWLNEDKETDKPYDIVVELESGSSSQQFQTIYIEAKSTAADEKELLSISWTQLKFAEDHGGNFHLYRVYRTGRQQSHLCMLENLHSYIKDHHIRFSFIL